MRLTLAFSPCPNDTFIFDAIVNKRIDTKGFEFEVVMEDVETLNRNAFNGVYDITKLSFATFAEVRDKYELLNSGSALGRGCGPLVITKNDASTTFSIKDKTVAIPGFHTTADLLFSMFYPQAKNKVEMGFSEIEDAVLSGKVDLGVIIHENRFTYEAKGLKKVSDLGELWERKTGQPIPLGGISIRKDFDVDLKATVDQLIRESVQYACANPSESKEFVKAHSQEMDEDVIRKHIELYVNEYSIDLGDEGRKAVETLLKISTNTNLYEFMNPV